MSAIEPLGYPDWQRLTNWDGPVLWQPAPGVVNAQVLSPVMRVDRYQSLACLFSITAGKASFVFSWYADQALAAIVAQRAVYLDSANGNTCLARLVNLGAWCQIAMAPIAGGSFTFPNAIFAVTNRSFPSEFTAINSTLVNIQGVAIAAAGNLTSQILQVVAGRAHLWTGASGSSGQVRINAMNSAGVYTPIVEQQIAAGTDQHLDLELPQVSVNMQLTNTGGVAGTYWGVLVGNGK